MAKADIILPKIESITPPSGKAGTKLVIKGSGFVDGNNIHGVFFGGVPTHDWDGGDNKTLPGWNVVDDNTIDVIAPEGPDGGPALTGKVAIMVRTEGGVANFGGTPQESNAAEYTYSA